MRQFAWPAGRVRSALSLLFAALALMLLCTGAARADSFTAGQYVTYGQVQWGTDAATFLTDNYDEVYLPTVDVFTIGMPSPGHTLTFTGRDELVPFLPQGETFTGVLDADYVNPVMTSSGPFGGDVAALKLNIDFSDSGLLPNHFGDLWLTGLDGSLADFNGITLRQFESDMNGVLGGGTTPSNILQLDLLVDEVDVSFLPPPGDLTFADAHLTATNPNGSTMATPEPSSLVLLASGLLALGVLHLVQWHHENPN